MQEARESLISFKGAFWHIIALMGKNVIQTGSSGLQQEFQGAICYA
jgi:hypothetical protein